MVSVNIPVISITVLGFLLSYLALGAASNYANQEKISESVVVVGKVFCDTCLENRLSENGYVISGASIAVECALNRKGMSVSVTGETNQNGEFKVEIPSNIFHLADQMNKCWVRPRSSPLVSCKIPSMPAPSKLKLQSNSNGVLTYSAGSFSYRHETVPVSCYSEDFLTVIRGRAIAEDADQSSKAGQQTPTIPSLPKFPPAGLPNAPTLPKFSIPPLPSVPPLPKTPSLPSAPALPQTPPLPGVPPLPQTPPLPSVPPLPQTPPLPSGPPLLQTSPLPQFGVPPFPIPSIPGFPPLQIPNIPQIPQIPQIPSFQIPQIPFLTPPTPGQKNNP